MRNDGESRRNSSNMVPPGQGNNTSLNSNVRLSAKLEPFDSFWQAPKDIEKGYVSFRSYYEANYLKKIPANRDSKILVISCGPGYLLDVLQRHGYRNVSGIDSDPEKISYATARGLKCHCAEAFSFLEGKSADYDVIIPEQELNHLTLEEMLDFLRLCYGALVDDGVIIVYGLNGANPLVGAENLAHNIDHFNTFTEYSLSQILQLAGFENVRPFPLKLYVFWRNPLNYVGLAITTIYELWCRLMFKLYGKDISVLSKKLGARACRPSGGGFLQKQHS